MVDSRASMRILSKKYSSSEELEPLQNSRNPTTVITANGEVQTNEEAEVYVHDFELFVTVQILEILSFGKFCEEDGYSYEWASGQKPQLTKNGKILCNTESFVPIVVPGLSSSSSASSSLGSSRRTHRVSLQVLHFNEVTIPTLKHREATSDRLRDLPDWLEEFTENLYAKEVSTLRETPTNSSHDSDSEHSI